MLYRKKYIVLLFFAIGFYGCSPDNGEVAGPSDDIVYDYSLIDINPNSAIHDSIISPSYFENQVTLHYFGYQY